MCSAFAKFAEKWNPLPETLLSWSKRNCDKIQPRPNDMTCEDIVQFVADCNFGAVDSVPTSVSNSDVARSYYQQTYGNNPRVLGKYIYYNEQTARDYGHFGNWYYPNYYPPSYLGWFDGRPESIAQLENDYKFAKGGNYPFNRADNMINIGLQQTSLPTCLHDLFYCIRAANPSPYQRYYAEQQQKQLWNEAEKSLKERPSEHHRHRHHHHRKHDSEES
ncbi:unnamed protein product [Auanema sp. JU1783]|nr:unnamed protein product [Auanema sp. JU1783]